MIFDGVLENQNPSKARTQIIPWINQTLKEIHIKTKHEKTYDYKEVSIRFGFTSDWMTKWWQVFKHSNENPKETQLTFDAKT